MYEIELARTTAAFFFSSFAHQQLLIRKIHTKRNLMKIFAKINKGNLIKVY